MSDGDPRRDFRHEDFDTFARELGRVVLIWNDLHISIYVIFWGLTNISNGIVPGAIWHSLTSDRAQRKMTRDLATLDAIGHQVPDQLQKDIKWLLDRADELENDRNNLVHSPFISLHEKIIPFHLGQHRRALTIDKNDIISYCTWFYNYASALRNFSEEIDQSMREPEKISPRRPRLPSRTVS